MILSNADLIKLWNASNPGSCGDIVTFAEKVIAENTAKVLKDLKPTAYRYRFHYPSGPMDGSRRIGDWRYIDANTRPIPESADCSEPLHSADQVSALIQERDALAVRVKELEKLSVTNIMIDIVPGWDGEGEEVFAKSVNDVERLLSEMGEKVEEYELQRQGLRAQAKHLPEPFTPDEIGRALGVKVQGNTCDDCPNFMTGCPGGCNLKKRLK